MELEFEAVKRVKLEEDRCWAALASFICLLRRQFQREPPGPRDGFLEGLVRGFNLWSGFSSWRRYQLFKGFDVLGCSRSRRMKQERSLVMGSSMDVAVARMRKPLDELSRLVVDERSTFFVSQLSINLEHHS